MVSAAILRAMSRRAVAVQRPSLVAPKLTPQASVRALASAPPRMVSRYVLFYDYTADVLEKRDPHRAGHLGLLKEMSAEGRILFGGAFSEPVDGAMVVFTDREAAEEFKARDPYGPHVVASGRRSTSIVCSRRGNEPVWRARRLTTSLCTSRRN